MTKLEKEVLTRDNASDLDWFKYNKEDFLPLIYETKKILFVARLSDNPVLK